MTEASGAAPVESSIGRASQYSRTEYAVRIMLIAAQLGAALLLVYAFEIETPTFFYILLLACGGFLLSAWLPTRFRLPLFAALSIGSVYVAIGFDAGSVVLATGTLLIVICHLPLGLRWRVGLIVLITALLAIARARGPAVTLPPAALPVLASMFMFRLALYLQELSRRNGRISVAHTLSYFFMLPNAVFPLFPVVDCGAFRRTHFDAEAFSIYDEGVHWIVRGLLQLLLYRIVAYHLMLGETWANDLGDVVQHVVTAFLLYIRVSGQFHLIIGMLHLFGFRLPETHHLYFLAGSVTDFWRRINIYWKDFMVKLVFYPSFFRLRNHGVKFALVASTMAVFCVTWALHSYQHFWIQGALLLSAQDASFWGCFAVLVVIGTLRDTRGASRAGQVSRQWNVRRGLATVTTFAAIAVLWSFWVAESVDAWAYMWTQVKYSVPHDWLLLAALAGCGLVAGGWRWHAAPVSGLPAEPEPLPHASRRAAARMLAMSALCLFTVPGVYAGLPPSLARITRDLQARGVPVYQQPRRAIGYYQQIEAPTEAAPGRTWRHPDTTSAWSVETFGYEKRAGFLVRGLPPGLRQVFSEKTVTINRWGMRDRDYVLAKTPGTLRIVLVGPSDVMGWGVSDHETFEALLESELDSIASASGHRVEILNISVPGWIVAQEVYAMSTLAARFSPDLVLLAVHQFEMDYLASTLKEMLWRQIPIPDSALSQLVHRAHVTQQMSESEIRVRLRLIEEDWNRRVATWATETAAAMNAQLAALVLRGVHQSGSSTLKPVRRALNAAGVRQLDCTGAFAGSDEEDLWTSSEDDHPNAEGHRLIAKCVLEQLRAHPSLLPTWLIDR